jgi:hypothetical protein
MPRNRHRFRPGADSLEAKASTSAITPRVVSEIAAASNQRAINGKLTGGYISTGEDLRPADGTLPVRLNAAGLLTRVGRVTLAGTLDFGGFGLRGSPDITGTVTLTNAAGSLTLRVTGTGGHGPIPGHVFVLNAAVVGGTGAYANVRGIGTVTARFGADTIRCITAPCPIGGALSLTVNLRPPIR